MSSLPPPPHPINNALKIRRRTPRKSHPKAEDHRICNIRPHSYKDLLMQLSVSYYPHPLGNHPFLCSFNLLCRVSRNASFYVMQSFIPPQSGDVNPFVLSVSVEPSLFTLFPVYVPKDGSRGVVMYHGVYLATQTAHKTLAP